MRKILVFLFFFLGIAFVILSFGELDKTFKTLQHGDPRFIALAIVLLLGWILNDAACYRSLYHLMDIQEELQHLVMVSAAANFVNVVAPSGGFGGVAVFVDDAGKRNIPRGLAAAVGALYLFMDYAAFMVVLALGWVVFIRRHDLRPAEVTASIIMLGLVLGMGTLIYIGSRSGEQLGRILAWLAHQINRLVWPFTHREYFREVAAVEFGYEIAEGLSILRVKHRGILVPYLHALGGKTIQTLILMLTFLAFQVNFSAGTVVAGFATCYLFLIVSPTPSGIGVVEGVLPLALSSLGLAWEEAVVVTLTYRGITFWTPLLIGGVSFRLLQKA
jgi:glycosyltransferase 2 family protein